MQTIRWTYLLSIVISGLLLAGCTNYKGDGKFTSNWPAITRPEYWLVLPEFDLGQPTSVSFKMSGLPSRYYFARLDYVHPVTDEQFDRVDTQAKIMIVRTDGGEVLSWNDHLVHDPTQPSYLQTWRTGFDLSKSPGVFKLSPNESYLVHVEVTPHKPLDFPVRVLITLTSVRYNPSSQRSDESPDSEESDTE